MKKVDNGIYESGIFSAIKEGTSYKIYKSGELIEVLKTLKEVKNYIAAQ